VQSASSIRAKSVVQRKPSSVAEVKYLTWTEDNLLRQVVYEGLREDKPAADVRRPVGRGSLS
jgi:bifunctional non-homologous end joining protein LigD